MPMEKFGGSCRADFGIHYAFNHVHFIDRRFGHPYPAPFWFQLYVMKDMILPKAGEPPKAAECSALMLYWSQILGQRHKDIKNGLTTPPKLTKILWIWLFGALVFGMLGTPRRSFGNIIGHVEGYRI